MLIACYENKIQDVGKCRVKTKTNIRKNRRKTKNGEEKRKPNKKWRRKKPNKKEGKLRKPCQKPKGKKYT